MRFSFLFLVVFLLAASFGTSAVAETGTLSIFTANLSIGSTDAQVVNLQQVLNKDRDTRVADIGPGSPGNETNYFGSLTRSAVIKFQEKYASEILAPAGLTQGNGYVGFFTRIKLNAISAPAAVAEAGAGNELPSPSPVPDPTPSPVTPTPASPVPTTTFQNPNLKNLDKFMAAIDRVAAEDGRSATSVAAFKEQVMKEVATTTNLRATFLNIVRSKSQQSFRNDSFIGRILSIAGQALDGVFKPERARAATGTPFGGALVFSFFCACSDTWLITIEPLPPKFAALLSYVPKSQAYLSYNIPATEWLLGEFIPGTGVCLVPAVPVCIGFKSEGMIAPKVGSSPLSV